MIGQTLALLLQIATLVSVILGIVAGARALREQHAITNSRFTELLEVTKRLAHMEGVAEERDRRPNPDKGDIT